MRWRTLVCVALAAAIGCDRDEPASVTTEQGSQARPSPSAGTALVLDAARAAPGMISLGPRLELLYSTYGSRYGWRYPSYLELCGHLVNGSLVRGTTRETLGREFYAIEKLDAGSDFHATTGALADRAGRTVEDFLVWALDQATTHEGRINPDVTRFNTAYLADGALSVWRFAVGHEYQRRYGESLDPDLFEAASRELSQTEIDSRLRSMAAKANAGNP